MSWWSERDILLETGLSPTAKVDAKLDAFRYEASRFADSARSLAGAAEAFGDALWATAEAYDREASEAVIERGEDPARWPPF